MEVEVWVTLVMGDRSTTLRAARPTVEEGLVFARYLDVAAEGFFRVMLGRRSEPILATAFVRPDHDFSYRNVTFAEQGSGIVGMVSGYTGEQHRRASPDTLREAAGPRNLRLGIVLFLFAPLMRTLDTMADEDFYLQAIAVDAERRGDGLGSVLWDACEEQARRSGSARLVLDVSAKNEGARRFYERRGMTIESQWPRRVPVPGFRLYRMTKTL